MFAFSNARQNDFYFSQLSISTFPYQAVGEGADVVYKHLILNKFL